MSEPPVVRTLEAALARLNLSAPEDDAARNLAAGDERFVGIYGYSVSFPGVPDADVGPIFADESRFWAIEGTSDCVTGRRHFELIEVATRYAERYNRHVLQRHQDI